MSEVEQGYNYTSLDDKEITNQVEQLYRRVTERFPDSGLRKVCRQVHATAKVTERRIQQEAQPIYLIRFASWSLIGIIVLGLLTTIAAMGQPQVYLDFVGFVQALESAINDVVLIGAAIFFLSSFESRIRRVRLLRYLHELRSLAHVIDMHQLSKDPGRLFISHRKTDSSPGMNMTPFQLSRYLDYCSELLSLVGKMAALYAENFNDSTVLSAVSEVETLSTAMAGKVWQKLMILHSYGVLEEAKEVGN